MDSLLFDMSGYDPMSVGSAVLALCAVAALAAWRPARRIASVDPSVILRSD
jgi:ABC-type lipoprotein release transport system permease subunit